MNRLPRNQMLTAKSRKDFCVCIAFAAGGRLIA